MQQNNKENIVCAIITLIMIIQLVLTFSIYIQIKSAHGILQSWDFALVEE